MDERGSGCLIGSCPMVAGGVAYGSHSIVDGRGVAYGSHSIVDGRGVAYRSHSIVDGRGVAYGLILRPSGVNEWSTFIQWLSIHLLQLVPFLWIFSTTMIVRSRLE